MLMNMKKVWQMREGSIVRNRKEQKKYHSYRTSHPVRGCQFCDFARGADHIVRTFQNFWIVENLFPYHIWDSAVATEHLLLVPKRHIESISEFSHDERVEYMAITAEYESTGYNIYARSPSSGQKTVPHQHTHFIKIGRGIKSQLYLNKPHINIVR